MEWRTDGSIRYALSNLPAETPMVHAVELWKSRWHVEQGYQQLKEELGLDHFEGRSWPGFHHHASLCIAAYGFLLDQRLKSGGSKKNSARSEAFGLPEGYKPRGSRQDAAPRPQLHRYASISVRSRNRPAPRSLSMLREADGLT